MINQRTDRPQPHEFLEWTAAPLGELNNYGKEDVAPDDDDQAYIGLLSLSRGYMWPTDVRVDEVGGNLEELSFGVGLEDDEKKMLSKALDTWGPDSGLSIMVKRRFVVPWRISEKNLVPRFNESMDILLTLPRTGHIVPNNQVLNNDELCDIWFYDRNGKDLIGTVVGVLPLTVEWEDEKGAKHARIVTDYEPVRVVRHCVFFDK